MAGATIALEAVTIVLRGNFNPRIFQPYWLAAQDLIAPADVEAAQIQVIHNEISAFSVGRFELQITDDRFMAATTDAASYELLRDLVVGVFSALRHTPLSMMGLNSSAHLRTPSEEAWHKIGHILAPKAFWEPVLEKPGTRSVAIMGVRPDDYKGFVGVRVEPSGQIAHGVFVDVNDHFQPETKEPAESWSVFAEIIETQWKASRERAAKVIEHVRTQI